MCIGRDAYLSRVAVVRPGAVALRVDTTRASQYILYHKLAKGKNAGDGNQPHCTQS